MTTTVIPLNYRRDILTDEKWQAEFEREKGYRYNIPPRTWEELADIAEFFNGKDWNGDGEPDYGISMALQKGQQAGWHFISLASPYMMVPSADGKPTRYKGVLWFDPETMEPLINQPGFLRALEMLIRLYKAGNPAQLVGSSVAPGMSFWTGNQFSTMGTVTWVLWLRMKNVPR